MNKIYKTTMIQLLFVILIFQMNSQAQTNWIKSSDNPISGMTASWTSHGFPFVYLSEMNDTLRMWFTGSDGSPSGRDCIGYAQSVDGQQFNYHELPVFKPSIVSGAFDTEGVFGASVLFDGTTYRMWYNAYNVQPYYAGNLRVGLATSTDGINWSRYSPDPVLELGPPGSWDDKWAYCNTVLYEDNVFKMWYTGFDGSVLQIGYAESTDGINWTKSVLNPVVAPQGSSSGGLDAVQNPRVIHTATGYEMWFNGKTSSPKYHVYYASSADGITWSYTPNTVLSTGNSGTFDDLWVWCPSVILKDNIYKMWYSGYNGNAWAIGYATDSTLLGIEENKPEPSQISLFPNPAANVVNLSFSAESPVKYTVKVINMTGQVASQDNDLQAIAGSNSIQLALTSFPAGLYLIRLEGLRQGPISRKIEHYIHSGK